jgi:hypothetical protein
MVLFFPSNLPIKDFQKLYNNQHIFELMLDKILLLYPYQDYLIQQKIKQKNRLIVV